MEEPVEALPAAGTDDELTTKWHGVPPAGGRPAPSRWRYILEITGVLIVEFILWAIYRAATADFYGHFGTLWFYVGHIIAAPTIHLGPILLYWKFIRKERIFEKDDWDGDSFQSFNFGPFKMTKRMLFSAVLVGLFGGILWRFTEMAVYSGTSSIMGGSEFGSLTWFDLFTGGDIWIFFLMTFVMFFIVGPVEEFEFRSFVHDQSQRVLPKWGALIFSSVFFGFSHIPIAIFVYKLPFIDLVVAEISWMTAGAVFGALYMWSRNIFACIIMHGIGNWQLSVFMFQAKASETGLTHTQDLIASVIVSIVANAFLIAVFFLIHRFVWEPVRRGEPAFGGKLLVIQKFFHSHDTGSKNVISTAGILGGTSAATLVLIVIATMAMGTQDFMLLVPTGPPPSQDTFDISTWEGMEETRQGSGQLQEGASFEDVLTTQEEMLIRSVSLELRWTDEQDIRRIRLYENQPDTFSLTIVGPDPNMTKTMTGENTRGGDGILSVDMSFSDDDIRSFMDEGGYNVSYTITLVETGMYLPRLGPGFIGLIDSGNSYEYTAVINWLSPTGGTPPLELA